MDYQLLKMGPTGPEAWFEVPLAWVIPSILILACVAFAIRFFIMSSFDDFNNRRKITGFSLLAMAGIIGIVSVMTISGFYGKNTSNEAIATENIKAKYNVTDVSWDAKETKARPTATGRNEELLVTDDKGQQVVFKYKVNMQTGEPVLSNMPVQGGSTPTVTVESIEKK